MAEKPIKLSRTGEIPEVEVQVSAAHLGTYSISLWDAAGKNPRVVKRGDTGDPIPDKFPLTASVADFLALDGHLIGWMVAIQRFDKKSKAPFAYRVIVRQGGSEVEFADKGELKKSARIFTGSFRITLV